MLELVKLIFVWLAGWLEEMSQKDRKTDRQKDRQKEKVSFLNAASAASVVVVTDYFSSGIERRKEIRKNKE